MKANTKELEITNIKVCLKCGVYCGSIKQEESGPRILSQSLSVMKYKMHSSGNERLT